MNDFFYREDPPPPTLEMTRQIERDFERPLIGALRSLAIARRLDSFAVARRFGDGHPARTRTEFAADVQASDAVIRRYLANKNSIETIAASRKIPVVFVWQPVPTYRYDLRYHVYDDHFGRHELSRIGYSRMRSHSQENPLGDDFIWCADLQAGAKELL